MRRPGYAHQRAAPEHTSRIEARHRAPHSEAEPHQFVLWVLALCADEAGKFLEGAR